MLHHTPVYAHVRIALEGPLGSSRTPIYRSLRTLLESRGFVVVPSAKGTDAIRLVLRRGGRLSLQKQTFLKHYQIPASVRDVDVRARAILLYVGVFCGERNVPLPAPKGAPEPRTERPLVRALPRPSALVPRAKRTRRRRVAMRVVRPSRTRPPVLRRRPIVRKRPVPVRRPAPVAPVRRPVVRRVAKPAVRAVLGPVVRMRPRVRARVRAVVRKRPVPLSRIRTVKRVVPPRVRVLRAVPRRVVVRKPKKRRVALGVSRALPPAVRSTTPWWLGVELAGSLVPLGFEGLPNEGVAFPGGGRVAVVGGWKQWSLQLGVHVQGVALYTPVGAWNVRPRLGVAWEFLRWSSLRLAVGLGGFAELFWLDNLRPGDGASSFQWRLGGDLSLRIDWQITRQVSLFALGALLLSNTSFVFRGRQQEVLYRVGFWQVGVDAGLRVLFW